LHSIHHQHHGDDDDDQCVFVLALGLVKILRGGTDTSRSPDDNNDASKIPIARS